MFGGVFYSGTQNNDSPASFKTTRLVEDDMSGHAGDANTASEPRCEPNNRQGIAAC